MPVRATTTPPRSDRWQAPADFRFYHFKRGQIEPSLRHKRLSGSCMLTGLCGFVGSAVLCAPFVWCFTAGAATLLVFKDLRARSVGTGRSHFAALIGMALTRARRSEALGQKSLRQSLSAAPPKKTNGLRLAKSGDRAHHLSRSCPRIESDASAAVCKLAKVRSWGEPCAQFVSRLRCRQCLGHRL